MAIELTISYKDAGGTVIDEKTVAAKIARAWKRVSTMGHPGTSRPYGISKLADFNSNVSSADWTSAILQPGRAVFRRTSWPEYYEGDEDMTVFGMTKSFSGKEIIVPDYTLDSNSRPFADVCKIPIVDEDLAVTIANDYYSTLQNLPNTFKSTGFYISGNSLVLWRYGYNSYNPEITYRIISVLPDDGETFADALYKKITYYLGYGDGNILRLDASSEGWSVAGNLPYPYAVNPHAFAASADLGGIPLYDGQSSIIIYDPVDNRTIGEYAITPPSGATASQYISELGQYVCTPNMQGLYNFFTRYGMLYFDSQSSQAIGLERGKVALYVGDFLYIGSTNLNGAWQFSSETEVTNNMTGDTFMFGDLTVFGQGTFLSIGDSFYITRGLFNPYMNVYNIPYMYHGEWTVIALAENGVMYIPVITCKAADLNALEPPAGAESVEITAILTTDV